jgi:hypothetical protein
VLIEARDRLVFATWPIWSAFVFAWNGEWLLLTLTAAWFPLTFPLGLALHVTMFIVNCLRSP